MQSWGTILRVFKRYFITLGISAGFIEGAIYVGMHSNSPYIMFPYILGASLTGLYTIIASIARMVWIDDHGWPEISCGSCNKLQSKLSAIVNDRDSLHRALAELEVK